MAIVERNGYYFHNAWFDFIKTEAKKGKKERKVIKAHHTALYCFYVHLNNKIGWEFTEFAAPSAYTMKVLGDLHFNTFTAAFKNLVEWGFIELISESTNQHTAREIKLCTFKNEQAVNNQCTTNDISSEHIYKPLNYLNSKIEEVEVEVLLKKDFENFEEAWTIYLNSTHYNAFKKKYGLSELEIKERFSTFWDYQMASEKLKFTKKECFKHFYHWHPKELKGSEENVARIPEWKKDFIKVGDVKPKSNESPFAIKKSSTKFEKLQKSFTEVANPYTEVFGKL